MSCSRFLHVLLGCALLTAPTSAADLAKIERKLVKEPVYKSKALYCLLVFGPEAKTRAWLVLDGDTLYIDRHADGDLTHADDRLMVHRVTKDGPNVMSSETKVFLDVIPPGKDDGQNAPTLKGSPRYSRLSVSHAIPREKAIPPNEEQKEYLERLRSHYTMVFLRIDGKYNQMGWACFSEQPGNAPILHFDGPLTLGFGRNFGPFKQPALRRGPDPQELMVCLETPGLGKGAMVTMDNRFAPADVHPVADIAFPGKQPGDKPLTSRVVLKERC
jgi:hypothetical protein